MRLFFALLPDTDTREQLGRLAAELRITDRARRLAPENYHLTLAFIGEARESDLCRYRDVGASLGVPRCAITLNAVEYWPTSQAVVLAARENPSALVALTDRLRSALAAHSPCRGPERGWRAHATLARNVAQAPVLAAMPAVTWASLSVALMRSVTGGGHAVYTVVDSWSLLDEA